MSASSVPASTGTTNASETRVTSPPTAQPISRATGVPPIERTELIVYDNRIHLTRRECTHHYGDLSSLEPVLGAEVRWRPGCGARTSNR